LAIVSVKDLVVAGVHFGHGASRWNPKMEPYIYGKRNLIHIIDLKETIKGLIRACRFVTRIVAGGELVLFAGCKRQAKAIIEAEATRCGMPYVCERWLGGMLTNFQTIRSRLERLEELERMEKEGIVEKLSKKVVSNLEREKRKIKRSLGGVRDLDRLPGALFVVDPRREKIAVREANKLEIPTVALIDTDCDPDTVDIPIPGNDDSLRSISLICHKIADAVLDGKRGRVVPRRPKAKVAVPVSVESEQPKADLSTLSTPPVSEAAEPSDDPSAGRAPSENE